VEANPVPPGGPTMPILRLAEAAAIRLPIQPIPLDASLIVTPDGRHSSLVRRWRPGDPAFCRLCPAGACVARVDYCHMVIPGVVPLSQAPLWSTLGSPRVVGLPRHD